MPNGSRTVTGWVGWIYFASIFMILRGISQAFLGITAIVNKHYLFTTPSGRLVYSTSNLTAWGWVDIAIGILVFAAGFLVLHGSRPARLVAVFFAGLSFLVNMAFLDVFPVWSIVAMIMDGLIIYALVAHGDEVRRA